jgi:hypothetical protein
VKRQEANLGHASSLLQRRTEENQYASAQIHYVLTKSQATHTFCHYHGEPHFFGRDLCRDLLGTNPQYA